MVLEFMYFWLVYQLISVCISDPYHDCSGSGYHESSLLCGGDTADTNRPTSHMDASHKPIPPSGTLSFYRKQCVHLQSPSISMACPSLTDYPLDTAGQHPIQTALFAEYETSTYTPISAGDVSPPSLPCPSAAPLTYHPSTHHHRTRGRLK